MRETTPRHTGLPAPDEEAAASWPFVERRSGDDRRRERAPLLSRCRLRGRRAAGRRASDQAFYVDRYSTGDLGIILAVLLLNILDAWFTLVYISKGGSEANPVARKLLDWGIEPFVYGKSFFVALCLIFLLVHKTFRLVRPALVGLLGFYLALLGYHIWLQLDLTPV